MVEKPRPVQVQMTRGTFLFPRTKQMGQCSLPKVGRHKKMRSFVSLVESCFASRLRACSIGRAIQSLDVNKISVRNGGKCLLELVYGLWKHLEKYFADYEDQDSADSRLKDFHIVIPIRPNDQGHRRGAVCRVRWSALFGQWSVDDATLPAGRIRPSLLGTGTRRYPQRCG